MPESKPIGPKAEGIVQLVVTGWLMPGGIESEIPWSAKRRRIPNTVAGCGCDDAGSGVDSPHAMLIRFCDVDISLHIVGVSGFGIAISARKGIGVTGALGVSDGSAVEMNR